MEDTGVVKGEFPRIEGGLLKGKVSETLPVISSHDTMTWVHASSLKRSQMASSDVLVSAIGGA
jgi:hypothetical protein